MSGHSRSKDGVALLAYAPGIHVFLILVKTGLGIRPLRTSCAAA
jgi:hypothetical protein